MKSNFEFYTDQNGCSEFYAPPICQALMELRTPQNGYDQISCALRVKDKFNSSKMQQAIQRVVNDNDALRMLMVKDGERYKVRILNSCEFELREVSVEGANDDEKLEKASSMITEELMTEIPIFEGIPIKAIVYHLSENDHILLISVDHVNYDGYSLVKTGFEILKKYMSPKILWKKTRTAPLLDYYKEREISDNAMKSRLDPYWKKLMDGYQLLDFPPVLNTPEKSSDELFHLSIDRNVIDKNARLLKTSPFVLSMAAYYYAVYKVYGKDDIAVHFASAGREDPKYADTLGPFAELLTSRTRLYKGESFRELISILSTVINASQQNKAYIPYEITRAFTHGQFVVTFENFQEMSDPDEALGKYKMSLFTPKLDTQYGIMLAFIITYSQECLEFGVHCDLKIWRAEDVKAIMEIIEHMLSGADLENFIID